MSTWILLRGLTRETRHWGNFPAQLQAALPTAAIHALDLPGNGSLHRMTSPWRIEATAAWCRAEAARHGLPPPYHLLAMSLGAMVAVAWAAAAPDAVAAAVLINTSLRPYSPFHQRLRPASYATLLHLALPQGDRAHEAAVLKLTSRRAGADDELLTDWSRWRRQHPVSRANALRQLLAAARYRAPAAAPVPMLLLAGAQDGLVNPECSRRLARAWGMPLVEHPTAGHDLPLDDRPWVAAQTGRWWAERPAPPAGA